MSGEKRMYQITSFDSVSARHAVYQRELERLATECEEHLDLLAEAKPDSVRLHADRKGARSGLRGRAGLDPRQGEDVDDVLEAGREAPLPLLLDAWTDRRRLREVWRDAVRRPRDLRGGSAAVPLRALLLS